MSRTALTWARLTTAVAAAATAASIPQLKGSLCPPGCRMTKQQLSTWRKRWKQIHCSSEGLEEELFAKHYVNKKRIYLVPGTYLLYLAKRLWFGKKKNNFGGFWTRNLAFIITFFRKMNEKDVADGKVLFLRSLDGICPDIPLQRNKETVIGRRSVYGFEINHFADFRWIFSASFLTFLKINKLGRSYMRCIQDQIEKSKSKENGYS